MPDFPCLCRGYDPADPCMHGDSAAECPRHDPKAREAWLYEHGEGDEDLIYERRYDK